MPVAEMMTKNVVSVKPNQNLSDVKELFSNEKFHYNIPVIENGELKGMVVLTDFIFAIKNEPELREENDYSDLRVKDVMRERVYTIPPATTVREAARIFSDGEVHTVMVTENNQLQGILSSADILKWLIKTQP